MKNDSSETIRQLEIARSMMHRPAALFPGEPTIGLDPVAQRAARAHLRELRNLFGTVILMTTPHTEEADGMCKYVAIMHRGRAAATGSPESLRAA